MFVLYVTQLCQNEGTETPRHIYILKTFVGTLNILKILILDLTLKPFRHARKRRRDTSHRARTSGCRPSNSGGCANAKIL